MAWMPYLGASPTQKGLLDKIIQRPKATWFGHWQSDADIQDRVEKYIELTTGGDPEVLVQTSIFRMEPWEQEACKRLPTAAEQASYQAWIDGFARGVDDTHMAIIMQPDGPFVMCAPGGSKLPAHMIRYAVRTLSALPNTSVYIDAGAADWCENDRGNDPERCAQLLMRTGIEYARGFALDSTHYTGPADNIAHGTKIVAALRRSGYGVKHFIIDTAKSGRPTMWNEMIPDGKKDVKDNARVCRTSTQTRCVTLGIPPTVRTADPKWGLPADVRAMARRYVDGFVWFGRPWLYNQADPFVMKRALTMAKSTPWPGPLLTTP
jgi:endoglucanase